MQKLHWLSEEFDLCRLPPESKPEGDFFAVVRTSSEISIVCPAGFGPSGARVEAGWLAIEVVGPLDFALVGVLASIAAPLAASGIPIFAISTFDTDYIFVRSAMAAQAEIALVGAGFEFV